MEQARNSQIVRHIKRDKLLLDRGHGAQNSMLEKQKDTSWRIKSLRAKTCIYTKAYSISETLLLTRTYSDDELEVLILSRPQFRTSEDKLVQFHTLRHVWLCNPGQKNLPY